MKAKLNNMIARYEAEQEKIKHNKHATQSDAARVYVIGEVLKALYELRR